MDDDIDCVLGGHEYSKGRRDCLYFEAEIYDNPYTAEDDLRGQFIDWLAGWCDGKKAVDRITAAQTTARTALDSPADSQDSDDS